MPPPPQVCFVPQVGLQRVLHGAPGAHVGRAQPEGAAAPALPGRACPVTPSPAQPPHSLQTNPGCGPGTRGNVHSHEMFVMFWGFFYCVVK